MPPVFVEAADDDEGNGTLTATLTGSAPAPPIPLLDALRIARRRLHSHPPSRSFVLGALVGALVMTTPLGRHVRDGRAALAASLRTLKHDTPREPAEAEPCLRAARLSEATATRDER